MWVHWVENRVAIIRRATDGYTITQGTARVCVCISCSAQLPPAMSMTTHHYQPNVMHVCVCVCRFPNALSLPLTARTHWPTNRSRSEKSNGKNHISETKCDCDVPCVWGKTEGYMACIRASRDTIQDSSSSGSRFSLTYIRTLFLFQRFRFFFFFLFFLVFGSPCVVCSSVRWSRIVCAVENVCVFLSL